MCGGSVQPGVFTAPVFEMAALRRAQTMGGGPPVQEHISIDPVEHRNGRKEQFAISPLRARTPTARYLNRGCHGGAQARVENIDRPGSKLHLQTGSTRACYGCLEGYPRIAVQIACLDRAGDEDGEQPAV